MNRKTRIDEFNKVHQLAIVAETRRNWWLICGYCHTFTTDMASRLEPVSFLEPKPMRLKQARMCPWCVRKGALLEGWIPEGYLPTWWGYYDGYEDADK